MPSRSLLPQPGRPHLCHRAVFVASGPLHTLLRFEALFQREQNGVRFDDRIKNIRSGVLPPGVTGDMLSGPHLSVLRNPKIAEAITIRM